MEAYYFTFHRKHQYGKFVQQVISQNEIQARSIMAQVRSDWEACYSQTEFEAIMTNNQTRVLKPLPPLYISQCEKRCELSKVIFTSS